MGFIFKKGYGVGYMITLGGRAIYSAGDTDFIHEMKGLRDMDVALLPIGGMFTVVCFRYYNAQT